MDNSNAIMLPVMTHADHHSAAAEQHEEATESHRNAAANYAYGDFQKASEHARLAKDLGDQAQISCMRAMK